MKLHFTPAGVLKSLCRIIAVLLILSITGNVFRVNFPVYLYEHKPINFLIKLFDVDLEDNIPSFYSACAILLASILLLLIAVKHKKEGLKYLHWMGLAFIFIFLAIDEFAEIHEKLIEVMKSKLHVSGFLYYAWVIPYTAAGLIILVAYTRFLLHLPKKTRNLIVLSGFIYVMGAVVIEMLSGKVGEQRGEENALYYLIVSFEELFEMFGIALFIYTLLSYINEKFGSLEVAVTPD